MKNFISIVKQMTFKDKVVYSLLFFIIFFLGGAILYMNIFYHSSADKTITLNEEFKDKNLYVEIVYSEVIFSDDLFIDYELSPELADACEKYSCFLFTEVYNNEGQEYLSLGPIINLTDVRYSSTGTTVIPNSLFSNFNVDKNNYKVRLRVDMSKGNSDELIKYSDVLEISN